MQPARVMLKTVRITGWMLLVLLVVQFTTIAGIERWLHLGSIRDLMWVHVRTGFAIGLVAVLHVIAAFYLAVRRWTFKSRHPQT